MQIRSGKFMTEQQDEHQFETVASPTQIQSPKALAQLSQSQRQQITQVFILFDKDKDGLLTTSQLATVLRALGFNPSNHQMIKLSQKIDPGKSGYFGEANLLDLVMDIGENSQTLNDIIEALKVFEKEGSPGKVQLEVLKEALLSMGQKMNEAEFAELLSDGDIIFGNLIDIQDFAKALYNRGS